VKRKRRKNMKGKRKFKERSVWKRGGNKGMNCVQEENIGRSWEGIIYSFCTGKALQNLPPTHHMATKIKEYLQIVLEKERLQKTVSTVNSGPFLNCRGRAALQEQLGWLWLFSWSGCR
jgi:hypothetical protein